MKRINLILLFWLILGNAYAQSLEEDLFDFDDVLIYTNQIHYLSINDSKEYSLQISKEDLMQFESIVKFLKQNPNILIEVAFHTDDRGKSEINKKASQYRSDNIKNYLVEMGIASDRINAHGYGAEFPRIVTEIISKKYNFLHTGTLLTTEFINSLDDIEKKEICQNLNRRLYLKIIGTKQIELLCSANIFGKNEIYIWPTVKLDTSNITNKIKNPDFKGQLSFKSNGIFRLDTLLITALGFRKTIITHLPINLNVLDLGKIDVVECDTIEVADYFCGKFQIVCKIKQRKYFKYIENNKKNIPIQNEEIKKKEYQLLGKKYKYQIIKNNNLLLDLKK